jgi:hypothetical protein
MPYPAPTLGHYLVLVTAGKFLLISFRNLLSDSLNCIFFLIFWIHHAILEVGKRNHIQKLPAVIALSQHT